MGAWQEIADLTVQSNTQSVVLDNFGTITKDDFVKIVFTDINPTGTFSEISIYPNTASGVSGFNTQSNYNRQVLFGEGSTVQANRGTTFRLIFTNENTTNSALIYFKISENGVANFFNNQTRTNTSSINTVFSYVTTTNLNYSNPVTSLTFTATTASAIGTGSRIQIYKLAAEKVADITVDTNSTQVNIPFPTGELDPAIDKDSEYLLVSDLNGIGTNAQIDLTINDSTSRTNYYRQIIVGSGTSAFANRANTAFIGDIIGNNDALIYSHIKLSNIGAYTSQSYNIQQYGTSDVQVVNSFLSSTSESVTSITKLNIVSNVSNAIGAGSRFILYKLY